MYHHRRLPIVCLALCEQQAGSARAVRRHGHRYGDSVYPQGWLRELPFAATFEGDLAMEKPFPLRAEVYRVWHSRFTHLYRVNRINQDVWYPGGQLADTVDSICLKDRP